MIARADLPRAPQSRAPESLRRALGSDVSKPRVVAQPQFTNQTVVAHAEVPHAERQWARDEDGDGVNEVHDNTLEGIWTGLRNFLRKFRGVNKTYLAQYVATFLWAYNIKEVADEFLRVVMGVKVHTICRT